MRRLWPLALLVAGLAIAAPVSIDTTIRKEFTDCASGGSAAQTLAVGSYLLRITDTDLFLCFASSASTCASGGEKFPVNTVILLAISDDQKSVSCRSSASTGDAIFTRGE